jgi:hypothetical protein
MTWTVIYRDTNQTIEQDEAGEQRVTYANPNEDTLRKQAAQALDSNRAFLALASPTAAQNAIQIKALTRQVQAIIRFELDDLSGTD